MSNAAFDQVPLPRMPTGIAGFDQVLHGGFLRGGLYTIAGSPGAGKTILGSQICFHHVATGGRAVFMTLLTESHSRMLAHFGTLTFFDPAPIGSALQFYSGYSVLASEGLSGLLQLLRRVIKLHSATVLVIDGVNNAEIATASPLAFKQFLHDLHALTEISGCTTFLLTHVDGDQRPQSEHTTVDGLVALSNQRMSPRTIRELEVWKLRGSGYLEGQHFFTISEAGITVYPRTEIARDSTDFDVSSEAARCATGVAQIDGMLHGGLLPGSTTMVVGPTGSGKTIFGLHFLAAGARANQRGLYFGLYESPSDLVAKADKIGLGFGQLVTNAQIAIQWHPAVENSLDVLVTNMLQVIEEQAIERIFIDAVQGFQFMTVYPERLSRFLVALSNELRARKITTILAGETRDLLAPTLSVPIDGLSGTVDNIILLRQVELRSQLYRLLSILKVRASAYDSTIREFQITSRGIEVATTFESADAILTGIARTTAKD